jgi:hypothetical protein
LVFHPVLSTPGGNASSSELWGSLVKVAFDPNRGSDVIFIKQIRFQIGAKSLPLPLSLAGLGTINCAVYALMMEAPGHGKQHFKNAIEEMVTGV